MNQITQNKNIDNFVKSLSKSLKDSLSSPSENDVIDELKPKLVLNPSSLDEISDGLNKAAENGLTVCPIGGATRLSLGNPPVKYDIALNLKQLNNIVEYRPSDLSITVQAGITLEKLQTKLSQSNQFLPISAPLASESTIGGILAIGTSGPLNWLNGSIRDIVTGMKTVQSDGTITKSGGQVMKNVSGYDMSRLHIGGLGTLGIISEVSLKVTPKPLNETTLIASFRSQLDSFQASMSMFHSTINTLSLSHISPTASHKLNLKSLKTGHLVAIRLYGRALSIKRCIDETNAILKPFKPKNIQELDEFEHTKFWKEVADFGWRQDSKPYISIRISLPPTSVGEVLGSLESTTATKGVVPALLTQIEHGTILFQMYDMGKNIDDRKIAEIIADTRRLVRQRRGTAIIEQAPLKLKQKFDVWDGFDQVIGTFQILKSHFDSADILNSGRLFPSELH